MHQLWGSNTHTKTVYPSPCTKYLVLNIYNAKANSDGEIYLFSSKRKCDENIQ